MKARHRIELKILDALKLSLNLISQLLSAFILARNQVLERHAVMLTLRPRNSAKQVLFRMLSIELELFLGKVTG